MILTILGLLLKLIGIVLAIPKSYSMFCNWKTKQVAKLYEEQHWFVKTGNKPAISRIKRIMFKAARMPLPHLWKK